MRNLTYLGLDKITEIVTQLDEAINGGSQTVVGIEPRVSHTFAGKSDSELRFARDEYAYAGHLLACESGDAALLCRWPNPYDRASITSMNYGGNGYPGWRGGNNLP
jgi:hypothetical protein